MFLQWAANELSTSSPTKQWDLPALKPCGQWQLSQNSEPQGLLIECCLPAPPGIGGWTRSHRWAQASDAACKQWRMIGNGNAISGILNTWRKIASATFIFTVVTRRGVIYHFNVNRILQEILKDECRGNSMWRTTYTFLLILALFYLKINFQWGGKSRIFLCNLMSVW